jgi:hypothetical protein
LSEFENSIHLFNGQSIPEGEMPKYVYLDTGNIYFTSPYIIHVPADYAIVDIIMSDNGSDETYHVVADAVRI